MRTSRSRILGKLLLGALLLAGVTPGFESEAWAQKRTSKVSGKKKKKTKDATQDASKHETPKAESSDAGDSSGGDSSHPGKKYILGNIGLSPQPLIGLGATVGMPASSGRSLEGSLTFASGKKGAVTARIIHLGARYRFPLMKIGYVAGGGGLRMASGAWNVLGLAGDEYPASSSLNAVTLDGAVGAQTKLGTIILGADVLGISFPLFKLGVKKTAFDEGSVDIDDANKQQAAFDSIAAGMNMTLLKIGVGISF